MDGFETILYQKRAGIALITLHRPQVLNIYNIKMRDELYQVLEALRDDDEVAVAIFHGEGRAFCAGADLTEFLTAPSPTIARRARFERDVWELWLSLPQPLIAAVHGFCLGSGLEMALCCDLRIAAEDTRFGLPELGLGILPAAGGTQTLPRAIKRGWALHMLLTGDFIPATEALRMGLVNRVVPRQELLATAEAWAQRLQRQPLARKVKELVRRGRELKLREGLELEWRNWNP